MRKTFQTFQVSFILAIISFDTSENEPRKDWFIDFADRRQLVEVLVGNGSVSLIVGSLLIAQLRTDLTALATNLQGHKDIAATDSGDSEREPF